MSAGTSSSAEASSVITCALSAASPRAHAIRSRTLFWYCVIVRRRSPSTGGSAASSQVNDASNVEPGAPGSACLPVPLPPTDICDVVPVRSVSPPGVAALAPPGRMTLLAVEPLLGTPLCIQPVQAASTKQPSHAHDRPGLLRAAWLGVVDVMHELRRFAIGSRGTDNDAWQSVRAEPISNRSTIFSRLTSSLLVQARTTAKRVRSASYSASGVSHRCSLALIVATQNNHASDCSLSALMPL